MQKYVSESSPSRAFQLFRKIIQLLGQLLNPAADHPVDALRPAPLLQRQITQAEQIQRRIERLLRVVKALQQVLVAQSAQRFFQIDQRLLDIVGDLRHRLLSPNPVTPSTLNTSTL